MSDTDAGNDALHLVAEGITALAGFGVAAISVVEGDQLRIVAVAGSDDATAELMHMTSPVDSFLAELEPAEDWGRLTFLPHERAVGRLAGFEWVPDMEVLDLEDAWHPHDLLCALLHDEDGVLRGLLSVDLPVDGRRPGQHQRDVLEVYARQAEQAVVRLLERQDLQHDLVVERRVSHYRARLINVIAHELKTPTTVILGRAELALDGLDDLDDPDLRRDLDTITRAATRISTMADDLLVMARADNPDRARETAPVDLVAVGRGAQELLLGEADRQGITLGLAVPDTAVTVSGDLAELEAVALNLVSNAVKYTDRGGHVLVSVRTLDAQRVELAVADDGIGISDADQDRLFEEFFRSPSPEAHERPGTGLGLAIVERVVGRHHGRTVVDSELGRGTTVRVVLPRS